MANNAAVNQMEKNRIKICLILIYKLIFAAIQVLEYHSLVVYITLLTALGLFLSLQLVIH